MPRPSPNAKRLHGDGSQPDGRQRGPRVEIRRPARTQTSEGRSDSGDTSSTDGSSDSFSDSSSFSGSSSSSSSSMRSSSSSSRDSDSYDSSDSGSITVAGASSSFDSSTNPERDRRMGYPMFDAPSADADKSGEAVPFARMVDGKPLLYGRFEFRKILGQGAFARVVEAFDTHRGEWIALKIFRASPKGHRSADEEAQLYDRLAQGGCVHHLQLLERVPHALHSALVFPLLGPSLLDILKQQKQLSVTKVRTVVWYLLRCIASLTAMGMIHTDIKPENTLVTTGEKVEIVVIDFGNAELIGKKNAGNIQTRHYRAPEVIFGDEWGPAADLWSVGCMIPELLTGDCMFMPKDDTEHIALFNRVIGPIPTTLYSQGKQYRDLVTSEGALRHPVGKDAAYVKAKAPLHKMVTHGELLDLTRQLLLYDPSKRLTARDALRHPFFNGMQ